MQCVSFTGITLSADNQSHSPHRPNNQKSGIAIPHAHGRARSARNASASEHSGVARGRSPSFRKFWPAVAGQLKICNAKRKMSKKDLHTHRIPCLSIGSQEDPKSRDLSGIKQSNSYQYHTTFGTTIPLQKRIKKVVNTTQIPVKDTHCCEVQWRCSQWGRAGMPYCPRRGRTC